MTDYPIPYLIQHTQPATEPLSLEEVKLYLRVDGEDEDEVITRLIRAARQAAEQFLRRSLITQGWMLAYDDYAPSRIPLPRGPVQSVTSVKIIARDGNETLVSPSTYFLNAGREQLVFDATPIGHSIEIVYETGYGDAEDVPEAIKQGMLAHIADMYDRRTAEGMLNPSTMSFYKPFRTIEL